MISAIPLTQQSQRHTFSQTNNEQKCGKRASSLMNETTNSSKKAAQAV